MSERVPVEMEKAKPKTEVPPLALEMEGGLSSSACVKKQADGGSEPMNSPITFRSLDSLESVEDYVRESLSSLEERLETVLDSMSEELAAEVTRERQHLLLMQEQVDKQSRVLQHEFGEIHKALEQEKTARALVQHGARERSERMSESLAVIARELEEMRALVSQVAPHTHWMYRLFNGVWEMFRQCAPNSYMSLSS